MLNGKENGLDEEYIKRREASKLIDPKLVSFLNRATSRILSNQSLDGISGIVKYENAADFSDYDFSSVEQLPERIIDSKMKYSKNTGYRLLANCLEKFISCIEEEQQTQNLSELYYPRFILNDKNSRKCYASIMKPYIVKNILLPCKVIGKLNNKDYWNLGNAKTINYDRIKNKCGTECDDCASIFENDFLFKVEQIIKDKEVKFYIVCDK